MKIINKFVLSLFLILLYLSQGSSLSARNNIFVYQSIGLNAVAQNNSFINSKNIYPNLLLDFGFFYKRLRFSFVARSIFFYGWVSIDAGLRLAKITRHQSLYIRALIGEQFLFLSQSKSFIGIGSAYDFRLSSSNWLVLSLDALFSYSTIAGSLSIAYRYRFSGFL